MSENPLSRLFNSAQFKEQVEELSRELDAKEKQRTKRQNPNMKRWQAAHPLQRQAVLAVKYAVKTGKLVRGSCIINDNNCHGRIEAHHLNGYEKDHWLDIIWLCRYHHEKIHIKPRKK